MLEKEEDTQWNADHDQGPAGKHLKRDHKKKRTLVAVVTLAELF